MTTTKYRLAIWICNWLELFDSIVSLVSFTFFQPSLHAYWLFQSRLCEWLEAETFAVRKETREWLDRD